MKRTQYMKWLAVIMLLVLPVLAMWLIPKPETASLVLSQKDIGFAMVPLAGLVFDASTIQGLFKSFKTLFQDAFGGVKPLWDRIAMEAPSETAEEVYPWLGSFPKLREWLGDRVIRQLGLHDYTIKNKDFEDTVAVARNAIQDDKYGVYKPMFQELGRAAAAHPDELVFTLLKDAFTTLCYDGQYLVDTDHPVGDTTVSNSGGGAGNPWFLLDVSRFVKPIIFQKRSNAEFVGPEDFPEAKAMRKELIYGVDYRGNVGAGLWQLIYGSKDTADATNYEAARVAMQSLTNDEGVPLGIMPNLVVCGPSNEGAFRELLLSERTTGGQTNKWRGTAELLVVPWLP